MSGYETAHRNCWLSWTLGKIDTAWSHVNQTVYWDRQADRMTRIQADDAIAAAEKLRRMADDLEAIAARRIKPGMMEEAA